MALAVGTRLGPYEVTALLGAGGMGEVYRAKDTMLGRFVALKVLRDEFATDRDRLGRLEREARVLATLVHPNIGAIHGMEESSGVRALVLELVEGPTLRDRLSSGPLSMDEVLDIARQIAAALEAAHEQGIVHRDLKPANIKIRPDGHVKVLDFGIAKAVAVGTNEQGDDAPTVTATRVGLAIGTPAYMSPEQARGEPVTRRTDVWAFGVVLFEMLAGRRPFEGATGSDVVAAVLRADPPWQWLPARTPPAIARLVRRCLERDARSRLHDIGDARLEIEDAQKAPAFDPAAASIDRTGSGKRPASGRRLIAWSAAVAGIAAIATAAFLLGRRANAPNASEPVQLSLLPPVGTRFVSIPAISPDGRVIAFVAAAGSGATQLWIEALSARGATPLAGTEGATYPFWSPDSRSIAFFATGRLKSLNVAGTAQPIDICAADAGRGGAWLDDGSIVFAPRGEGVGLMRIAAGSGAATALTTVDASAGERGHRFPLALPNGQLAYVVWNQNEDASGLRLISVNRPDQTLAFYPGAEGAHYARGFLLYGRRGSVVAQRLELPGGRLTGDPVLVATEHASETLGHGAWSASASGVVALLESPEPTSQFTWMSRAGTTQSTLGPAMAQHGVELSPDGRYLATVRPPDNDVWVVDTARVDATRLQQPGSNQPIWRDGSRMAFATGTAGTFGVSSAPISGGPVETVISGATHLIKPAGWTLDGTFVWVQTGDIGQELYDIWMRPASGKAVPYLQDHSRNLEARLSPDGRWIAFATDRSGSPEIVVQSFPVSGQRQVLSVNGGRFPRWRSDGREVFFVSADSWLMAVPVSSGDAPRFGLPQKLFEVKLAARTDLGNFAGYEYDVSADGSRFLVNRVISQSPDSMAVIVGWNPVR